MGPMTEYDKIMLVIVMIGWAFNLGLLWQMTRGHSDKLKEHSADIQALRDVHRTDVLNLISALGRHISNQEVHTNLDWREELRSWHTSMDNKLDTIQKQCMDRIIRGTCPSQE